MEMILVINGNKILIDVLDLIKMLEMYAKKVYLLI